MPFKQRSNTETAFELRNQLSDQLRKPGGLPLTLVSAHSRTFALFWGVSPDVMLVPAASAIV
jgi:hypothetical protein